MKQQGEEPACFLRKALMGNALFSTLSGLTILLAQGWVLRILGLASNVNLLILGVGLIVFAVTLVVNARRQQVKKSDAWKPRLLTIDVDYRGPRAFARQPDANIDSHANSQCDGSVLPW